MENKKWCGEKRPNAPEVLFYKFVTGWPYMPKLAWRYDSSPV